MRVVGERGSRRGGWQVIYAESHRSAGRTPVRIDNGIERRIGVRIAGFSQFVLKKVEVARIHLHQLIHIARDGGARRWSA